MAVFLILSILTLLDITLALPNGAPTSACGDLFPEGHFVPAQNCGSPCPFSLQLTAVDGAGVSGVQQQMYRCGSEHTSKCPSLSLHGIIVRIDLHSQFTYSLTCTMCTFSDAF